jgi:hypothetical protein
MRISSIRLKNFKRFSDLLVRAIPGSAKLVVVVGPNGCGKSSLFDALLHWYRGVAGFGVHSEEAYFRKDAEQPFGWKDVVQVSLHDGVSAKRGSLYVRTAYRNDPDFSISGINRPSIPSENVRLNRVIENDQTVSENYQRLVYDTTAAIYDQQNDAKTEQALRDELIGQVRGSLQRVFGNLLLNNIADPLGAGAFYFEKGTAKSYHYKNLSGGEKAAFDLLLDLHIKKKYYPDAVYCIDEVETHLHTGVQGALVRELAAIVPNASQLWVTTHSLGVLRAAQEMEAESPGSVSIIDFAGVDPDVPGELVPVALGRVSWEKLLSIALDDLSTRIAPRVVVVCEGSSLGNRRKDFDAEIYNRILGAHAPEILFVSGGSAQQVAGTGRSVQEVLRYILPTARILALADRDDKSAREVADWEAAGNLILPERNLESILFADDVIEALLIREGKQDQLSAALQVRSSAIASSVARGNVADDVKSAAGDTYTGLKQLLGLQRSGNNTEAFMRDTLAPLIGPGMQSYEKLRSAIVDRVQ